MTMEPADRESLRQYAERWTLVARREAEEIRDASLDCRLTQTLALMGLGFALGLGEDSGREDRVAGVRERWSTLRRSLA